MTYAVCAIARLENRYIREWVEHYKNIGFTHIILYDNNYDGEDNFEDVIGDYINSGYVILKNYRNKKSNNQHNIQVEAYQECYDEGKYDWIFFCDIDEFLILDKYNTIDELCSDNIYAQFNAIRFCWKYFDDNGLIDTGDNYNCLSRFTIPTENIPRQENQNNSCKTLIKTGVRDVKFLTAHLFDHDIGRHLKTNPHIHLCDATGKPCEQTFLTPKSCFTVAWLNHYRFKTIKEYIEGKQKRLWPDMYMGGGKNYLSLNTFFMFNKKTREKEEFANNYTNKSKTEIKYHKHADDILSVKPIIKERPKQFTTLSMQNTRNQMSMILSNAQLRRLLIK